MDYEWCENVASISLTALYLRYPGWRSTSRLRAATVLTAVRCWEGGHRSLPDFLESHGFIEEAYVLRHEARWRCAADLVELGHVCTIASDFYPRAWLDKLQTAAPPALWSLWSRGGPPWAAPAFAQRGASSSPQPLVVGGVGSRDIPRGCADWCAAAGRAGAQAGLVWVSGDAVGCDRAFTVAAARVGGSVVQILPCGVGCSGARDIGWSDDRFWNGSEVVSYLSVCPPDAPFSAAGAMERNALIYALSDVTVVGHSRYGQGGTWNGALDARRRRLCPLLYSGWDGHLSDDAIRARSAFAGLGTPVLSSPENLSLAVRDTVALWHRFGGQYLGQRSFDFMENAGDDADVFSGGSSLGWASA